MQEYRIAYKALLDALDKGKLSRRELIYATIEAFNLTAAERLDDSTNGRINTLRSLIGTIINEMEAKKIIKKDTAGLYLRASEKFIAIRSEECEKEILEILKAEPKTRAQIKDELISYFQTDTTPTARDDNKLLTYTGQILKRLIGENVLAYDGSTYSLVPERSVYINSKKALLSLKADFLTRLHSRGGEFFEHYFMNLLARYLAHKGKIIIESHVTGGSDDGGIDGIAKTVDCLGFRETIMVQTKNRLDVSNETDIRGFYGAVCANQGSRGIFATTSDFHPMAEKFLSSIDNCVGVNGGKIFEMAVEAQYGIIRNGAKLSIDREII